LSLIRETEGLTTARNLFFLFSSFFGAGSFELFTVSPRYGWQQIQARSASLLPNEFQDTQKQTVKSLGRADPLPIFF
jgi:hypothetical protein